jgi:serine/threonine-protein kinase
MNVSTMPPGPVTPEPFVRQPVRVGSGIPLLVVGLVLIVVIAGVGIAVVVRRNAANAPLSNNSAPVATSESSLATQPPLSSSADGGQSSGESGPALDDSSAQTALNNEMDRDRSAAETLAGNWVPQLSSKRPGLVADGITYDYPQIWADFQRLQAEYPNVLLIWSGDYVSFKSPDYYVTIMPVPSPDGLSANTWCDEAGLPTADCFAKFLSHTGGSSNTTILRQ